MGASLQSCPGRRVLVMESPPPLKVGHSNQVLRVTSKSAGNFGQTLKSFKFVIHYVLFCLRGH